MRDNIYKQFNRIIFGFDKRSYLISDDKQRQKLFDEWSQNWDLSKQFLVEKSPPNIIRTRFLQAMYPNASFVTILRDPIAVSFATLEME